MKIEDIKDIPLAKWKKTTYNVLPPRGKEELKTLKYFINAYELDKPTTGEVCVRRLKVTKQGNPKQCLRYNPKYPGHKCHIPHYDHPSLWLKDGKPSVYICHLYPFGNHTAREIINFCEKRDLTVFFRAGMSFWNPGRTIAVIVRREEDYE